MNTAVTWSNEDMTHVYHWMPGTSLIHRLDGQNGGGKVLDAFTLYNTRTDNGDPPTIGQVHAAVLRRMKESK